MRVLRRLVLLLVLAAAAVAVIGRRRRPSTTIGAPTWPPIEDEVELRVGAAALRAAPSEVRVPVTPTPTWVEAVDGDCPQGYPVKVNTSSGIFHVPGGRSYARTKPDRCYATPSDAEADGFRQAKL